MRNRRHLKIWIFTAVLLILIVTLLHLGEHPGKNMSSWRRREDRETEKIQLEEKKGSRYMDTLEKIMGEEFINPDECVTFYGTSSDVSDNKKSDAQI